MKNETRSAIAALGLLCLYPHQSTAIQGMTISVQGTDAVLTWPSMEGQRYVIRYSPVLNDAPSWTVLDNVPGAVGTNRTIFIHSSIVSFAPGSSGSSTPPGGQPPMPFSSSSASRNQSQTKEERIEAAKKRRMEQRARLVEKILAEKGRLPYPWEVGDRPPMPWDAEAMSRESNPTGMAASSFEPASGGSMPNAGFYRVDPVVTAGLTVANGQSLSGVASLGTAIQRFGTSAVQSVSLLLDGNLVADFDDPNGITNATFDLDTRLFPSGPHVLQLAIVDNSGIPDYEEGNAEMISDPIPVTFDNPIYGVDWIGVVERRFVAMFGTTVAEGEVRILLTDNLSRTWLDGAHDLADLRQADGTIVVEDSVERIYEGVTTFQLALTVTPAGIAPASPVTSSFFLTVNQRPPNDFGNYLVIGQDNTDTTILGPFGSFNANVQQVFDLTADNCLYAGQTAMYTINLNGEVDPFAADKIYPRNDTARNDFKRVRDGLLNKPGNPVQDYPTNITFLTYLGHGGLNFFGWGPGRPSPLDIQNVTASELKSTGTGQTNQNGVVNYAVLFGCGSVHPLSKIMKALIGTPRGKSFNYYGAHGLAPKFGFGFNYSGRVARIFLYGTEPYTPSFNFFNEWLSQTYIQRDGQGFPLYTFGQAFSRAAAVNAENLQGSLGFGMAGCTNCYLEEVITGRLRGPTAFQPAATVPATMNAPTGMVRASPPGQPVWPQQSDVR